jgi:parallel beta-helix repeat protein
MDLLNENYYKQQHLISLKIYVSLIPYAQYSQSSFSPIKASTNTLQFKSNISIKDMKGLIQSRHGAFTKVQYDAMNKITAHMELFLTDDNLNEDSTTKGIWLDPTKHIDYYMLRTGSALYYQDVRRILIVKMLDWTKKSVDVNDSFTVNQMMNDICKKCGVANSEEYSLARILDDGTLKKFGTLKSSSSNTLRQSSKSTLLKNNTMTNNKYGSTLDNSDRTVEKGSLLGTMKTKTRMRMTEYHNRNYSSYRENLMTDEDINWLNPLQTLTQSPDSCFQQWSQEL